ncbi:MAG: DUF1533 domain-containing protein [Blautia sp.]|uniref:penicillin-binding Tp47 domain C-containing protein n=1 Tax=Blautia sp. TaxID=1955243 RepID=UPI00258E1551|nr:penicillin-binding Tp47 domain C-containing protein [Blautia sp.]MCI7288528.1 DUF1533 domain-containing protein [Blautia sp.]MDY4000654.1 penicillin-binding Tp47 domain C-containing protein [Blautia sp.]
MKKRKIQTKILATVIISSMAVGLCPVNVFAVNGSQVAADGTYTSTSTRVERNSVADDNEDEWEEYNIEVSLKVEDGKFSAITVSKGDGYDSSNDSYFSKAVDKSRGIQTLLVGEAATEDTINGWNADAVTGATCTSYAVKTAALEAIHSAPEASGEEDNSEDNKEDNGEESTEEYKYVYAGLSWSEYWAAEGVQAAGNSASSDELDLKGEYDKGAFDTVTRATTNHGLHRGSYQCSAVIYMKDGTTYDVSYYTGTTTAVLTDGSTFTYEKTDIDHYVVTGLKYVPVKVKAEDYEEFCKEYAVVENGDTLAGGFSENKLSAYTDIVANVTEDTNGLKTVTKEGDTFTFSVRKTGTDSGIQDVELKQASGAEPSVKEANGSYGEFLRVDINGDYGDLAANMQAVEWTYYGDDATYTTALESYGTKFAADNWMHKSMGIQLGLTDSARCTLPEGTDGTGYWTVTVYALGYQDYTWKFQATDENIVKTDPVQDTSELEAAIQQAESLNESDYTSESWANMQTELKEAKEELEAKHSQSAVDEATEHLNVAIAALEPAEVSGTYVLMNIPYAEFYQADVNNTVAVDAFTSATLNKTRTASLAGGSYHVDPNGTDITGVIFPVKVTDGVDLSKYTRITDSSSVAISVTNRGQTTTTTYSGKDALFESASYSYYVLSETPSYYKEVSVNEDGTLSFGTTVGEVTTLTEIDAELSTETSYGDYQLDLYGLGDTIDAASDQVYGVIVSTKEGNDYGMRHLENIWRVTELAWCTGFTESVHGCPTSFEHYEKMMGQTINKITYYTSKGIYEIPVDDIYVPVKFQYSLSVKNAPVTAESTEIALTGLPNDFNPEFSVKGLDISVKDGKMTFNNAAKGQYTLLVQDKSGTYADISTDFILYTEEMPAAYNEDGTAPALVKTESASDDEFADYLKNIASVTVNGKSYAATGKGAVTIINENGTINTDAAPFAEGESFEMTVSSTGYQDLSFKYIKLAAEPGKPVEPDNPDDSEDPIVDVNTSSLEKAIANAEALNKGDYTSDSWDVLQTALSNAREVLAAKESQEAVDQAADTLNRAIDSLKKNSESSQATELKGSSSGTQAATSSGSTSPKTGDPAGIAGLLAIAASALGVGGFTMKRNKKSRKK